MLDACEICHFNYNINYTECYALFNNKRKNYLRYMLCQECIFFLVLLLFSAGIMWTTWHAKDTLSKPSMNAHGRWMWILNISAIVIQFLVSILFICRVKWVYLYREIEEI